MECNKYKEERERHLLKISKTGRKRNLEGILGTTGEGVMDTHKAVITFLKDIELYDRI